MCVCEWVNKDFLEDIVRFSLCRKVLAAHPRRIPYPHFIEIIFVIVISGAQKEGKYHTCWPNSDIHIWQNSADVPYFVGVWKQNFVISKFWRFYHFSALVGWAYKWNRLAEFSFILYAWKLEMWFMVSNVEISVALSNVSNVSLTLRKGQLFPSF